MNAWEETNLENSVMYQSIIKEKDDEIKKLKNMINSSDNTIEVKNHEDVDDEDVDAEDVDEDVDDEDVDDEDVDDEDVDDDKIQEDDEDEDDEDEDVDDEHVNDEDDKSLNIEYELIDDIPDNDLFATF
jgi:ribosome biogenesis protein BRX1